jgi:hypothetical protein
VFPRTILAGNSSGAGWELAPKSRLGPSAEGSKSRENIPEPGAAADGSIEVNRITLSQVARRRAISLCRFGNFGFTMSKTLFVHWRDNGFWAFDVVSAVFLKHLIEAAESHPEFDNEPWLADAIAKWRFNAVCGDLGLFLDDSWSIEQIATFTKLAREACDVLSKRVKIRAEEIQSWQMIEGDDGGCFTRGLPAVTTASAIRLGEAIIKIVNGTLSEPPPGTWWFFATEEDGTTISKRGE